MVDEAVTIANTKPLSVDRETIVKRETSDVRGGHYKGSLATSSHLTADSDSCLDSRLV